MDLPEDMQRGLSTTGEGSVATLEETSGPVAGGQPASAAIAGEVATRERVIRREMPLQPNGVLNKSGDSLPQIGRAPRPAEMLVDGDLSRDHYGQLIDQPWKSPRQEPLSTFSIDVDNASYTNVRRMILEGRPVQPDAVRIEELINYFDYAYPQPEGDAPFAVTSRLATCPWQKDHLLARVAIKGREIDQNARPASNLVFLIDVSGSMQSPDKLPMLKRAMTTLVGSLDERDRVGIVVYAGTEGVALDPTELNDAGKSAALGAIGKLESGGSTNGGAGISRAYRMALGGMIDGGVNRVILATDGDFNVGTTGQGELVNLVKDTAAKGVSLSVLGFGTGNLNDSMLEAITNDGNGNYFYIDNDREAGRIFQQKLTGTLVTIAKDVKIQVEFNPGKVKAFRLIGYANRILRHQDFNNDKIDAGDIGAGHTVTAFYEIVPAGVDSPFVGEIDELKYQRPADGREVVESDDWFTLKLRHKHPEGVKSRLITTPVTGGPVSWEQAGGDFRMAAAVALFGMKLRGMEEVADIGWDRVREVAEPALADDRGEHRAEFLDLLKRLD
jgi:Ca-activated chloride channel family protein